MRRKPISTAWTVSRRVIWITGGSSGIGKAAVRKFAGAGDRVAFTFLHSEAAARALESETGAFAIRADVSDSAQVNRARGELEQALGRSPRADEIADRLNVRLEDVLEALEIYNHRTVSLDSEDEETPIENFVGAEDAALEAFETSEQLAGAMSALSERERSVIRMRFFENLSQRQIAEKLNLSQMTVSRVERQALDALKKNIK